MVEFLNKILTNMMTCGTIHLNCTLFWSLYLTGLPSASVCCIFLSDFLTAQLDLAGGRGVTGSIMGNCGNVYGEGPRPCSIADIVWV